MPRPLTLKDHLQESRFFNRRTLVISLLVLLFTIVLVTRLIYLQIFQHDTYKTLSNNNQLELIPIKPDRGLIYDRNGVLLAENVPVFSLEITPNRVKDLDATIAGLQQFITISDDDIAGFHKLKKQHRAYEPVPLKLKLTDIERAKFAINQYRFPGVDVKARLIRHYPLGETLAHVLGYVGRINEKELQRVDPINYSATNFIGKLGLERYYEKLLHGRVGYQRVEVDASGRIVRVLSRTSPVPGNDIYLTLDSDLMAAIFKALGTHRGAVVAIDPRDGSVLALASTPSFNPNLFVRGISRDEFKAYHDSPEQPLYNRAIRGQYPLASTIKPFLALQGLDSGEVSTSWRIRDPGYYRLPRSSHIYRDWKRGGHGWVDVRRAIKVSCDTYFYRLALQMGITQIDSILTRFGFGIPTKIDMKEELSGLVPSPAWKLSSKGEHWYPGDTLVSGIGQGFMLTTPLQLANATAALSMRGVRHRPHLLDKQVSPDNITIPYKPSPEFPVVLKHESTWDTVIDAMRAVITEAGGTGYRFGRDAPYSVAAKTGTAQVYSSKFHEPFEDNDLPEKLRDHSLFIAFAPKDNPRIAVAVVVENSKLASEVARTTMDHYLLNQETGKVMNKTNRNQ